MARGQRTNLADLAAAVGDKSPVDRNPRSPMPHRAAQCR